MDLEIAIAEMNKFKHLHMVEGSTESEWVRRAPFIHVIEEAVSDRSYVAVRNALIPAASAFADIHTQKMQDGTYHGRNWTLNFLERMDQLWRETSRVHVAEIV